MAKFISVSGPSATGKTSIVNDLSTRKELANAVFIPDLFATVWQELVDGGHFAEYDDINKDTDFLCVYIIKLIERYDSYIDMYKDTDKLVIFDCCWADLSVYSIINMWYTHIVKEVQENILKRLAHYDDRMSRIYITQFDEAKMTKEKFRIPFKRSNIKHNRSLEIQYYSLAANLKGALELPTSDVVEASMYIVDDLKDLGYL